MRPKSGVFLFGHQNRTAPSGADFEKLSAFRDRRRLSTKVVMDDRQLLRDYVERRSESAFAELVQRHLNLVYATALRVVRDPHAAQDVAQAVFIRLARNAATIREGNALPGWLYRAACGTAKDMVRGEQRRREREGEAVTRAELETDEPSTQVLWSSIAPLLEEAMHQLNEGEQNAIVLRFFESKALSEVGRLLEISEDAAQKRVSRALEKLRSYFQRRGISISGGALVIALAVPAAQAAPPALAGTVTEAAFASGTAVAASALVITKTKVLLAVAGLTVLVAFVAVKLRRAPANTTNPSPAAVATFRSVGDLPGGEFFSYATAVSGDGNVVVGGGRSARGDEAFRWSLEDGVAALMSLPSERGISSAYGVSADGSVIVGSASTRVGAQAFRWTRESSMVLLGDLPGGRTSSVAYAVSAGGDFIVGESSSTDCDREGFLWTTNHMKGLRSLSATRCNSQAMAVSVDGSVVAGIAARDGGHFEAFRWMPTSGLLGLGDFPGGVTNSNAYGISADGRFIVGYGCPGIFDPYTHEAFRWTERGGLEHLGFAPGTKNSAAYAVSADGNVVVGDNKSERPSVALLWTPLGGMRRLHEVLRNDFQLNLQGWQFTSARGVSHDGRTIVGTGINPSGQTEGWVVILNRSPREKGRP